MYQNILFPLDLTEPGSWSKALPMAVTLCQTFGARLHVLNVVPDMGMSLVSQYIPENIEERLAREAEQALQRFVRDHVPADVPADHIVAQGPVYQCIIDTSVRLGADLIIMSAHRPELKDYLLGPNAARVVRHSDTSVLVVRG